MIRIQQALDGVTLIYDTHALDGGVTLIYDDTHAECTLIFHSTSVLLTRVKLTMIFRHRLSSSVRLARTSLLETTGVAGGDSGTSLTPVLGTTLRMCWEKKKECSLENRELWFFSVCESESVSVSVRVRVRV